MLIQQLKDYITNLFAVGVLSLFMTSCIIEEHPQTPAYSPDYRVRLSYTHNMAYEERASQIEAAEVYAFDADGKLAAVSTADRQTLIDNDWTLPLNVERFKDYELIVWGGLVSESPFLLDGTRAVTTKEDLTCRLRTVTDEDANDVSSKKFPGLFHGTTSVSYMVEDGVEERTVPMVKNTNDIHVLIQKDTGKPVEEGYYVVELTDANGVMDHQNNVSGSNILYRHHTYTAGDFQVPDGYGNKEESTAPSGKWEFSVARLMENSDARMEIRLGDSNITLVDEKLIDLIELIKPDNITLQEFLDRQDTYYLTYSLREDEDWLHLAVFLNDWLIIRNDIEWGSK